MSTALSYICDLNPYQPGLPIEHVAREYGVAPEKIIKIAANENPLGPSPMALQAFRAASHQAHRYPEQYELLKSLAQHLQVDPASIVIGNGSNDVLDLIARTYLAAGREAISSQYAFAIYQIATQSTGGKNVIVPATNYGHDPEALLAAITPATKVIWIANPNNPTGTFVPYAEIKSFLEKVPAEVMIVLDEAYYEYLDSRDRADSIAWLKEHPNLILVRTFSKIYGLAGLRIGYGMASPGVAELLNRVRLPFNITSPSIAAATAALSDQAFTARSYGSNKTGRAKLKKELDKLGVEYLPAYGNFVTIQVDRAAEVNEALLRQGIIVRPLASYDMPDHLRVSVGTPAETDYFLSHLQQLL